MNDVEGRHAREILRARGGSGRVLVRTWALNVYSRNKLVLLLAMQDTSPLAERATYVLGRRVFPFQR